MEKLGYFKDYLKYFYVNKVKNLTKQIFNKKKSSYYFKVKS